MIDSFGVVCHYLFDRSEILERVKMEKAALVILTDGTLPQAGKGR